MPDYFDIHIVYNVGILSVGIAVKILIQRTELVEKQRRRVRNGDAINNCLHCVKEHIEISQILVKAIWLLV